MFKINDVVMYRHYGICRIADIETKTFSNYDQVLYYVLHPLNDESSTFYIPVNNKLNSIRKLISVKEIYELIEDIPNQQTIFIEDDQKRNQAFCKIIKTGDHENLIRLIKTLYYNKEEKNKMGRKVHISDDAAMKEAEKILYQEFAYVLDINFEDVVPFIENNLQISNNSEI